MTALTDTYSRDRGASPHSRRDHDHADTVHHWKVYREYHEKLRRHDGWYCFVVYRPHGRSGCTILRDKMVRSSDLPLLRWHGGGDHRGTEQAKIAIDSIL